MKELIELKHRLPAIVNVVLSFGQTNREIYPIQDIMHDLQLLTYWLTRAIMATQQETEETENEIDQDSGQPIPQAPAFHTGEDQLAYLEEQFVRLEHDLEDLLIATSTNSPQYFDMYNALVRIIEAGFNTRIANIAYEGLQAHRRTSNNSH